MTTQKTATKIPMLRLGDQYWMMRPIAVNSIAKVIAHENPCLLLVVIKAGLAG